MPPIDPAAVDAAIAVVHGIASDRRKLGLNPTPQEILADACEYYRAELADGGYRIVVRCRGCKQTESTTFTSQEEAFDFSDQFSDLHAEKCGIWRSHCNYCGYTAQGTKQEAIEQSKSHDLVCEKSPLAETRQQLAAATERAEVERKELLGRIQLLTHQIITCGVAASHPDAGLASRGVYGNKWDSQQAGEVRALRKRCDDMTERAERMRAYDPLETGCQWEDAHDIACAVHGACVAIIDGKEPNQEGNADGN